jgi:serine/threonine protein kinase
MRNINNSLMELLVNGIVPMNNRNIYHCDIKDSNVLLDDSSNELKSRLIDWGLSTEYIPFKNLDRCDAYDLTPYDETLVLDIDIAIASDTLNSVWGCDEDILISNSSVDILDRHQDEFLFLKDHGIKFHWATEFYFRKSPLAEEFFTRCKTIKENYAWYAILYGIPNYPLRNDHVWSIAIHEMGYPFATIPRKLRYAIDKDSIVQLNTDGVVIAGEADKKQRLVKLKNQDVHLMNKFELVILTAFEMGVLL